MNNSTFFKKVYKHYLYLFCFSLFTFLINFFLAKEYISQIELGSWHYSIPELFIIFTALSFLIFSILLIIREINLDYVGYAFLLLTSLKMGIAYFFVRPILIIETNRISFEKTNFFILFICFLAIETLLTIRILNNKQ